VIAGKQTGQNPAGFGKLHPYQQIDFSLPRRSGQKRLFWPIVVVEGLYPVCGKAGRVRKFLEFLSSQLVGDYLSA
jgi:hypothetical protein